MFRIQQIKEAHSKVKSGADFPAYIRDLIELGVVRYETFVEDGHTVYSGIDGFTVGSAAKYAPLTIAARKDDAAFRKDLKEHQDGKSDYLTFCKYSAVSGVWKWVADMDKMTCTYYDKANTEMLVEMIPTIL
jgi:uncharacterized protein YbcV (DUF1398 family)